MNANDPAFPIPTVLARDEGVYEGATGMTIRDWLAGMALQGVLAGAAGDENWPQSATAAEWAYEYADAMIAQAQKGPNK